MSVVVPKQIELSTGVAVTVGNACTVTAEKLEVAALHPFPESVATI